MNGSFLENEPVNRRKFLLSASKIMGAAGVAGLADPASSNASETWPVPIGQILHNGDTILFQGDSITDAGRSREQGGLANDQRSMGSGYAWLAGAELLVDHL